jgi:hypothetical protein
MSFIAGAGFNDDFLRSTRAASFPWRPVLAEEHSLTGR